jgi:hypothetical protein
LIPRRIIGSRHRLQFVRPKVRCELLKRHAVTSSLCLRQATQVKARVADSISEPHDEMETDNATKAQVSEISQSE